MQTIGNTSSPVQDSTISTISMENEQHGPNDADRIIYEPNQLFPEIDQILMEVSALRAEF